ncbi:Tn3 family transposase [Legionella sp. PATHC035]
MRASNNNLTILSEAEQAALYEIPDFDDVQRSNYLNLTPEEQVLMCSRDDLSAQIHCAIQIGYFKAKHRFFPFKWEEVQEDIDFIMEEYFPEQQFHPTPISKHQYYAQCTVITAHFGYQSWSKEFEPLLIAQAQQILRRDVSPQFIVIELLAFMQKKKILRPGYTTLQTIVSKVLNTERNRLESILGESLTIEDKSALQKLLLEKEDQTLSELADLKQDTKDFKARMISAEREKLLSIKALFQLAKSLLPKLNLSQQNIHYYASLVDYYDAYELRKKLKSEQTYLYLLCYLSQRYLKLNDNLIDAFSLSLKQFEADLKEKTKDAYTDYAVSKQIDSFVMRKFAWLFINQELPDQLSFGDVRKKAFETIIPEKELRNKIPDENEEELKPIDFQWKLVDTLFHRCQLQLRPLMMAIDFSSTVADSPWLAAITWLKELFGANKTINQYPVTASPEKTRPKRLEKYLFDTNAKGEKKFHAERYEFWIYRQLKKRLKAGELYLADSVQNRSLQQELNSANDKGALVEPLDIPALRKPIKDLLDERCAELRSEWLKFNTDFTQGKLKHLYYDEQTKTLHLKKSSDEKTDEERQQRFYEQLPLCDITDVLRFVNERSRYSSAFTLIQPRYVKLLADENTLNAVIIAQALNNGNLNMAEISDIPYASLLDVYQSRVRLQTLKKANDMIGDDIAQMPIFPDYSLDIAILYGGVDGQKFEVARPTLKARRSKKYFKKGKGVVAYTLLVNHIPLQTELIGAHEHESYFAFDIWYNNTSSIMPEAITGDMHLINKANFAVMDWFGGKLCPRFTNLQAQMKHLYCDDDLSQYADWLIKPVDKIDRQLIEDEWPNIEPIIKALGCKEITQSILIKKLCTYSASNKTRKAIFEYDKLIRSIYTLNYLQDRKLQRDIHRSQNRVESYHQLRMAIATAYGKKQLSGRGDREIEISNQCARLIANAIIYYNSAILSKLKLKYEADGDHKALALLRKISPVAWQHIHFQGHFIFSGDKIIDLDAIINKVFLHGVKKKKVVEFSPEISGVSV